MAKFNKGDIVRCTVKGNDYPGAGYMYGKTYEVRDTYHGSDGERIHTVVDSNGSTTNGWHVKHFELAAPPVTPRGSDLLPQTADGVRTFTTGATRDTDEDKLDYEGFLSPLVLEEFAKYMHGKRKMPDGSMRDSDNWQKGIPLDAYMKSMFRHFFAVWKSHRTVKRDGGEDRKALVEELLALLFNVQGMTHEMLKRGL